MIFKQTLLSVSALAVMTVTAGAADMPAKAPRLVEPVQRVSGYVELYGGWARTKQAFTDCDPICDSGSDSASGWALGGAGRATWWWATNYSIQLDAQGEGTSHKHTFNGGGGFSRVSSHSYLIGGHANWRDPGRGLIGIFGGAGDATNFFNSSSVRHGLIGAEGQLYWGPVTLYAQGGYNTTLGQISSGFLDSIQSWFVRGTARVYATPNFRLEGTVLYADGDYDFVAQPAVRSISKPGCGVRRANTSSRPRRSRSSRFMRVRERHSTRFSVPPTPGPIGSPIIASWAASGST